MYFQLFSRHLTFKPLGWHLNFCTLFMKNVLLEQRKIKLRSEQHSMENKTDIMQHVLRTQPTSLLPKYIK
jgi:hypothetical protein